MRILIICDKERTAIWRLAQSVKRSLPHQQIVILPVHPKRCDPQTLAEAQKLMQWTDVIDIHYWKSGQVLREAYPVEFASKPKVLFHFNPYDIETPENQFYKILVVGNKNIQTRIPSARLIKYGVDLSFFKFNENYTEEKRVMMSVNRIESKKGIREVAQACKELGYQFTLVGRVSKVDYINEVLAIGKPNITFIESATDEILRSIYYSSAIHVCNSVDDYESGTLPILEAMACGVPVLTRIIGHVPDLYNGDNMHIRKGLPEDMENLKTELKALMENKDWRIKMRDKAWDTVRNRDDRRMALDIQHLYYTLHKPHIPLISIIIPTRDHPESFTECLVGSVQQDFPKFEIVIADSGDTPVKPIVDEMKKHTEIPIKYMYFKNKDNYTLAEARNRAVIEADGSILVFCDDRLKMAKNVLSVFATYHRPSAWLWGSKDKVMKGFVENFSCVSRHDLISFGLFSERMQWYGGMTQEIRERFEGRNGLNFIYMAEAEAVSTRRSSSRASRREDIIEAKFLIYKMYHK